MSMLGLTSDPMVEIGSLEEYLHSTLDQESIGLKTFLNVLKLLGITHDAAVAETLLNAVRFVCCFSCFSACSHTHTPPFLSLSVSLSLSLSLALARGSLSSGFQDL